MKSQQVQVKDVTTLAAKAMAAHPGGGVYSYGEISPFAPGADCRLHNQTMTVTRVAEAT